MNMTLESMYDMYCKYQMTNTSDLHRILRSAAILLVETVKTCTYTIILFVIIHNTDGALCLVTWYWYQVPYHKYHIS